MCPFTFKRGYLDEKERGINEYMNKYYMYMVLCTYMYMHAMLGESIKGI